MKKPADQPPVLPTSSFASVLDRVRNTSTTAEWTNLQLTHFSLSWFASMLKAIGASRKWLFFRFIGNTLDRNEVQAIFYDALKHRDTLFEGQSGKIDTTGAVMGVLKAYDIEPLDFVFRGGFAFKATYKVGTGTAYLHDEPDTLYFGTCGLSRDDSIRLAYHCFESAPDYPHTLKINLTCAPVWQRDVEQNGMIYRLREAGWNVVVSGVIPNPPNAPLWPKTARRTRVPTLADAKKAMQAIVHACSPDSVTLFGSLAKGHAGLGSDIDLLIGVNGTGSHWRTNLAYSLRQLFRQSAVPIQPWVVPIASVTSYLAAFSDPETASTAIRLFQKRA